MIDYSLINNPYDGLLSYDHVFETGAGNHLKCHTFWNAGWNLRLLTPVLA
jgi:hypothetical protein